MPKALLLVLHILKWYSVLYGKILHLKPALYSRERSRQDHEHWLQLRDDGVGASVGELAVAAARGLGPMLLADEGVEARRPRTTTLSARPTRATRARTDSCAPAADPVDAAGGGAPAVSVVVPRGAGARRAARLGRVAPNTEFGYILVFRDAVDHGVLYIVRLARVPDTGVLNNV
jgi:hypothetical protein